MFVPRLSSHRSHYKYVHTSSLHLPPHLHFSYALCPFPPSFTISPLPFGPYPLLNFTYSTPHYQIVDTLSPCKVLVSNINSILPTPATKLPLHHLPPFWALCQLPIQLRFLPTLTIYSHLQQLLQINQYVASFGKRFKRIHLSPNLDFTHPLPPFSPTILIDRPSSKTIQAMQYFFQSTPRITVSCLLPLHPFIMWRP